MSVGSMQRLVAELGTEAVQLYEVMSGEGADGTPEQFLEGVIAEKLYKSLSRNPGYNVHAERLYKKMAEKLGLWTPELKSRLGNCEADIAIYQAGRPTHIVELKVLDNSSSIRKDLEKVDNIRTWPVEVLLGILAYDKAKTLAEQSVELEQETGLRFDFRKANQSLHGKWNWCFTCHFWKPVEAKLDVDEFLDRPSSHD